DKCPQALVQSLCVFANLRVFALIGSIPLRQQMFGTATTSYNASLRRPVTRSRAETAMPVQMQLSRIIISEINPQQVIYLKEVEGDRTFPILIGLFEAESINTGVKR